MYKVHWIIDGIANVNEKTQEDAENVINSKIQKFLSEHSDFFDKIGAKAIQGKASNTNNTHVYLIDFRHKIYLTTNINQQMFTQKYKPKNILPKNIIGNY